MKREIEERDKDIGAKEAELSLLKDLVRKSERKEEELNALLMKTDECTKKLKIREEELDAMQRSIAGQAEELQLERKKLLKAMLIRMNLHAKVKKLESKEKQFKEQVKELKFKQKLFEVQLKELKSKQKQFEGETKDLESKQNQFEGLVKELEFKKMQYEALTKALTKYRIMKSSPTTDGRSLQLLSNEQTNEHESLGDDIIVYLQSSSDPAKLILYIIKDSIVSQCRKGDKSCNSDDSHIFLLEQLMRISPLVNPCAREETMKLALDLKANMRASTEVSVRNCCLAQASCRAVSDSWFCR